MHKARGSLGEKVKRVKLRRCKFYCSRILELRKEGCLDIWRRYLAWINKRVITSSPDISRAVVENITLMGYICADGAIMPSQWPTLSM